MGGTTAVEDADRNHGAEDQENVQALPGGLRQGSRHEDKELSDEQRAKIGRQILAFFREQGEKRNSEMPDDMRLIEVWITYNTEGGGFNEVASEIARQSSSTPADAKPEADAPGN